MSLYSLLNSFLKEKKRGSITPILGKRKKTLHKLDSTFISDSSEHLLIWNQSSNTGMFKSMHKSKRPIQMNQLSNYSNSSTRNMQNNTMSVFPKRSAMDSSIEKTRTPCDKIRTRKAQFSRQIERFNKTNGGTSLHSQTNIQHTYSLQNSKFLQSKTFYRLPSSHSPKQASGWPPLPPSWKGEDTADIDSQLTKMLTTAHTPQPK